MKAEARFRIMVCAVGLGLVPCGLSLAQDAPIQSPETQQGQQTPSVALDFSNFVRISPEASFSLTFDTYGNPVGVDVAPADVALRSHLNLADGVVVVTSITPDSEAAKAGLKQNDIVVNIDGQPITGPAKFNELLGGEPGKKLKFSAVRQGKPVLVEVTLPKTPVYRWAVSPEVVLDTAFIDQTYRIGVTLAEADDALRSQLKLAAGEGLVVTDVVADSPAAKAGIQRYDVLIKLDGKRLSTVEKINAQIQELKDRRTTLAFLRGGEEKTCDITAQLGEPVADPSGRWNWTRVYWDARNADHLQDLSYYMQSLDAFSRRRLSWRTRAVPITPAADQVAAIKKQLAETQKMLESLEASLQSQPAESPEKK